jgi:methionyl-tRNA formyltransferase
MFFGTDDFPVPILEALVASGRKPSLVVTKPDSARGRGRKIYTQRMKEAATGLGLPCEQPADVCDPAFMARLRELAPDVILVVSFGRILTPEFLAIPRLFCLNVHASLLPRWRGAAPIANAILAGDAETGVSIMRIEPELDAGPVMLQVSTPIGPTENAGELFDRLATLGGQALVTALERIEQGTVDFTPQDAAKATLAPKLKKEDGFVSWKQPSVAIDRMVRAYTPKPGARTRFGPRKLILLAGKSESDNFGLGRPGGVMTSGEEGIRVCTGDGIYRITRLKPENGRTMTAGEFVRGHFIPPDARFG